jgi:tetratricopeptide (TPR) repeat protein/O-antigen ligase
VGFLSDRFAQGTVLVCVAVAPWFFGGVGTGFQFVLTIALALAGAASLARWRRTFGALYDVRVPLTFLSAAFGLGLFQLTETAARQAEPWNPAATEWRSEFSADARSPSDEVRGPLSLHPASTRRELGHLATAIAAFVAGAVLFGETTAFLVLLITAAGTGAAVALFGIVQKLTWNGMIYWQVPLTHGGQPFGPFVNRNNAGGFLTMCLAAALGVVVWQITQIPRLAGNTSPNHRRRGRRTSGYVAESATWQRRFLWFVANVSAPLVAAAAAAAVVGGGILSSLSRGTIVATVAGCAAALMLAAFASRRPIYLVLLIVTAAAAAALVVWLGLGREIVARLDTLTVDGASSEPRMLHWTDASHAISEFWLLGSGLGTYRFAYAPFETRLSLGVFQHAENQYVETLVTGGIVGGLLLACLMFAMVVAVWRLLRRAESAADYGIAVAAAALFFMQAVHACFDFSWYIPADMVLMAVLCGAFFRRAFTPQSPPHEWSPSEPVRSSTAKWVGGVTAVAVGLLLAWGFDVKRRTYLADDIWREGLKPPENTTEALPWIDHVIQRQREALRYFPDDGEIHVRLAELWVDRYKTRFRAEARQNPALLSLGPLLSVWESPAKLHADAHIAARTGFNVDVQSLRDHPLIAENLLPALQEARIARRLCPISPYAHLLTGELCFLDESPLDDGFYLGLAEKLSGGRDDRLYLIGQLHLDAARVPQALECFRRAWSLSSRYDQRIVTAARSFVSTERLLNEVVPPKPAVIVATARNCLTGPEQAEDRKLFFRRAVTLLSASERTAANLRLEAGCRAELGELRVAADLLRKLITVQPLDADAYLELASVLMAADDAAGANEALSDAELRTRIGTVDRGAVRRRALDLIRLRVPTTPEALHAEAIITAESGDLEHAAELMRRALEARPSVAGWQYDAAGIAMKLGRLEEAFKWADAAVQAVPTSDEYRDLLESVRRRMIP